MNDFIIKSAGYWPLVKQVLAASMRGGEDPNNLADYSQLVKDILYTPDQAAQQMYDAGKEVVTPVIRAGTGMLSDKLFLDGDKNYKDLIASGAGGVAGGALATWLAGKYDLPPILSNFAGSAIGGPLVAEFRRQLS